MSIFETFFIRNINFLFAICGLLLSLIFFKRISKESTKLFYSIAILSILLTITSQFEEYLGDLVMSDAQQFDIYHKLGGDLMRTTLSVFNYVLRPAIILLFFQITTKTKIMPLLWVLVFLNVPIYTTTYYSNITFNITDNIFHGGSIAFFRYYSPVICFVLFGCFFVFGIINYKKYGVKNFAFNIFTTIFAVIVAIVEMKVGGNFLTLTIMIALNFYFIIVYDMVVDKKEQELIKINNIDVLTGLGNERAYYSYLEEIDSRKKSKAKRYAVVLMDLNGLKVTDDTLGHRFGCQLIIEFGHQLPEFFKTSKLYHIGGDEFVAILEDEDFRNRNKLLEKFIEKYSCKEIEFEGKKLILSVAIGMQENEKDKKYNEIFQMADKNMYANKKIIKKKYNIQSRIEEV